MSKYDFETDLSPDTSTGAILSRIPEGATVLEFGCAAGRMTRYMSRQLNCRVYIVEYDQEAYQAAREYAADGLCDDIMRFAWLEKFGDISFDAIVFADVLEHLTAPEKVLKAAGKLLKDSGSIHISIPNITHNAILLKAYDEHFDYTPTGLLDDTHVHFWGLHNIKVLADNCGLHVQNITGTVCPVCDTEQQVQLGKNTLLENILHERQCGEVYQFVLTLGKHPAEKPVCTFRRPTIRCQVYLNGGNGFAKDEVVALAAEYTGQGSYRVFGEMKNQGNLRKIRFVPVEGQSCILQHFSICQGQQKLPVTAPGGVALEDGLWLPGGDPAVFVTVPIAGEHITMEGEILLPGQRYIQLLEKALAGKCQGEQADKRDASEQTGEIGALKQDVSSYILLANKKDMRILELEQRGIELEQQSTELRQRIAELEQRGIALEQTVHLYQNLKVVRLHQWIVRLVRGIMRRIKRLLGK